MTFYKDKTQELLARAPEQVKRVYNNLVDNARAAEELEDSVYLGFTDPAVPYHHTDHEEWAIGDNYERSPYTLIYRPDVDSWFYRDKWDGKDVPMPGGFYEAMGNASCWYTG